MSSSFVIDRLFIRPSACFHTAQTISSLSRWALVGGLLFPHRLVVESSASLGLSPYICGLTADCPRLHVRGFQQFTQFSICAGLSGMAHKEIFRCLHPTEARVPLKRGEHDGREYSQWNHKDGKDRRHAEVPTCETFAVTFQTVLPVHLSSCHFWGRHSECRQCLRIFSSRISVFQIPKWRGFWQSRMLPRSTDSVFDERRLSNQGYSHLKGF